MIVTGIHIGKINPHSLLRSFWNLMMKEPDYERLAQQNLDGVRNFVTKKLGSRGI